MTASLQQRAVRVSFYGMQLMKTMTNTGPRVAPTTEQENARTTDSATRHSSAPLGKLLGLRRVLELIPVSKTTWYKGVKRGLYPSGRQISDGRVGWTEESIRALIEDLPEVGRRG